MLSLINHIPAMSSNVVGSNVIGIAPFQVRGMFSIRHGTFDLIKGWYLIGGTQGELKGCARITANALLIYIEEMQWFLVFPLSLEG